MAMSGLYVTDIIVARRGRQLRVTLENKTRMTEVIMSPSVARRLAADLAAKADQVDAMGPAVRGETRDGTSFELY
jgi:hypothetical protein